MVCHIRKSSEIRKARGIWSFNQYLLSICYVLDTWLHVSDSVLGETDMVPDFTKLTLSHDGIFKLRLIDKYIS